MIRLAELTVENFEVEVAKPQSSLLLNLLVEEESFFNHPEETFNRLLEQGGSATEKYLAFNPHTPARVLHTLVKTTNMFPLIIIRALLNHPNLTPAIVQTLWNSKTRYQATIARHLPPSMPYTLFDELSRDQKTEAYFAENPNMREQFYEECFNREKYSLRQKLASNLGVPATILVKIMEDTKNEPTLRKALMVHPNLPAEHAVKYWNKWVTTPPNGLNWYMTVLQLDDTNPRWELFRAKVAYLLKLDPSYNRPLTSNDPALDKESLLLILRPHFPEVDENMPTEWLMELADGLTKQHLKITVEELENLT